MAQMPPDGRGSRGGVRAVTPVHPSGPGAPLGSPEEKASSVRGQEPIPGPCTGYRRDWSVVLEGI